VQTSTLPLSVTLAPLVRHDPRQALKLIAEHGFRHVQLSAMIPQMRPRDLDRSARRDLAARLRRLELTPTGLDLWIPESHFHDPAHVDRALAAVLQAIDLAADLGRLTLSLSITHESAEQVVPTIRDRADTVGVRIANFAQPAEPFGIGIDPAACLTRDENPATVALTAGTIAAARFSDVDADHIPVVHGTGRLDIGEYQIALITAGYEQPVVLDLHRLQHAEAVIEPGRKVWYSTGLVKKNDKETISRRLIDLFLRRGVYALSYD